MYTVITDGNHTQILYNNIPVLQIHNPQDLAEVAAMLAHAVELYWEQYHEERLDAQAEALALQEAEDAGIRQRETYLELGFSQQGYDDIPF